MMKTSPITDDARIVSPTITLMRTSDTNGDPGRAPARYPGLPGGLVPIPGAFDKYKK